MSRRLRIIRPPVTNDRPLDFWLNEVADVLNSLPNMSIISTSDGPESNTTGSKGDIAIDVGSSVTAAWLKTSGTTTTGWQEFDVT